MSRRPDWDKVKKENLVIAKGSEPLSDLKTDYVVPPRVKRPKPHRKKLRTKSSSESHWRQCPFCPRSLLDERMAAHIKTKHPEYSERGRAKRQ